MLITIQPQDDAFCTVKTKRKFIRKRDATRCIGTSVQSAAIHLLKVTA